jgi:hypothetical protein
MKRTHKKSSAKARSSGKSSRRNTSSKSTQRQIKSSSKPRRKTGAAAKVAADPLVDFITASAHTLDLKIDPAWLSVIRTNLQVILNHAALVAEFALPDDIEPAPVFKA